MKQDDVNQAAGKEIRQIIDQIKMAGEQVRQNIADVKDAEVKKLLETYQEDVASQAAIDRYRDAMLHQMQKAVEDGDFDKMLSPSPKNGHKTGGKS